MKHSAVLSLATLSTTLMLSLSAHAHDPKAFDRMMEADPAATTVSACDELKLKQHENASADADIKRLQGLCDAEKKTKSASDADHASAGKK